MDSKNASTQPWARVVILVIGLLFVLLISWRLTGNWIPTDSRDALIFQNALLLIVLGSALLEQKFTKPADSVVNGLMGMLTLVPVYPLPVRWLWWAVFGYCGLVFVVALTCIAVSSSSSILGWRQRLSDLTYRPAIVFGKARVLYSLVFLYAVFAFYGVQSNRTATLVLFWGLFLALWPLKIPELLSSWHRRSGSAAPIGKVVRSDAPNIVHVEIDAETQWEPTSFKVLQQGDGKQKYVVPLFSQMSQGHTLGTGLCVTSHDAPVAGLTPGLIYERNNSERTVDELLGGGEKAILVGFVDHDSTIGQLRFQTWKPTDCNEGMLVWAMVGNNRVYYQVTEGITQEEGIESNRHGYQIAVASQLGVINPGNGFDKFEWLPSMNTPVFRVSHDFGADWPQSAEGRFVYGVIPSSKIDISGNFAEMMEYHTAILGVTGSGKTELTFDLIRHTLQRGTKVICIDLTSRYKGRLEDAKPRDLSISARLSAELSAKLIDVETGAYGAGTEKRALKDFADKLRLDVGGMLVDFLESKADEQMLGIISLEEISNTKATIYITELYLTCLLNYARDNPDQCPRVLLVVEEAHTVMPEASTMGLGDYDSRGLIAKIAQIALQGRKYHVGLLVIAQRTATVSKTILTQCNTVISFSCFDETSLNFLGNVFGKVHTSALPNLKFLQAVAFGKAVDSQRPVIIQIPFDEKKVGKG